MKLKNLILSVSILVLLTNGCGKLKRKTSIGAPTDYPTSDPTKTMPAVSATDTQPGTASKLVGATLFQYSFENEILKRIRLNPNGKNIIESPFLVSFHSVDQGKGFATLELVLDEKTEIAPECRTLVTNNPEYATGYLPLVASPFSYHWLLNLSTRELGEQSLLAHSATTFQILCRHNYQTILDLSFHLNYQ